MHNEGQSRIEQGNRRKRASAPAALWHLTTGLAFTTLVACGEKGGGGVTTPAAGSGPELAISSLSFSPSQANVGETIHVVDIVHNAGDVDALGFQVGVYLSTDNSISSGDTLIGLRSIGVLAPGQTSAGGGFLTIPGTQTEGDWYVGCIVDTQNNVAETNEADNAGVALQILSITSVPAPDLVPTQVTFDLASVEAGQPVGITDRVENLGLGAASSFQVGIYLSQDPTITTGDVLMGLRSVPSLDPGQISFLSSPLTVPANTTAGNWFVGSLADVGATQSESDEFNNTVVAAGFLSVTQPPRPDLRMSSLNFSPASLDAGQSVLISERVLNQGLASAGPFRVGIFFSTDGEITSADTLIGFRSVGGLDVGEESDVSAPLVVPASLGSGIFHVGAIADHDELLIESDEQNNSLLALGTIEVFVPPLPDLKTIGVSFSPNVAEVGDTITVIERIKNAGSADAAAFRVGTYLSNNPSVTVSDVLLGSRLVSSLAIGQENESLNQYTVPSGLGVGSWTLGVIVDDLQALQEPDEGNNLLVASGLLDITGSPDPMPDLIVEMLTANPHSVLEGGQLTVESLVRNQGDLSASTFTVKFYLSTDEEIEATDYLVGTRTIHSLGIGGGSAQSFPYTLSTSIPLGSYHFGALCDADETVAEADEGNNVQVVLHDVEIYVPPPPAPDLIVNALSLDVQTIVEGGTIEFSHTVKNQGNLDAGAHHVDYYLSEDGTVTSDDIWIGAGLAVPSLAAEAEVQGTTQLDLPATVTVGEWTVGAIVTTDNGPVDSNIYNNTFLASETLEVTL
jgi:subtilase family serine protease